MTQYTNKFKVLYYNEKGIELDNFITENKENGKVFSIFDDFIYHHIWCYCGAVKCGVCVETRIIFFMIFLILCNHILFNFCVDVENNYGVNLCRGGCFSNDLINGVILVFVWRIIMMLIYAVEGFLVLTS